MGKFSFGQTGVSYECDKVDVSVNEGSPLCPRCGQRVYFNEEKKAIGKSWHARCFTCCACKKALSGTNYNEAEGEIMCTTCHRKHASTVTGNGTLRTNGNSATAAEHSADKSPDAAAAASAAADGDDNVHSQTNSHVAQRSSRAVPLRLQPISKQDIDCCPQCGQTVYFAEEIKALKRKWHRLCFKCVSCKRTLEPGKCTEHDGQLFCHQCHHKRFGPHVLRATASSSSSSSSAAAAAAAGSGLRRSTGNGVLAYTDTLETGDNEGEDKVQPTQPIRGAQEWTESFDYSQTSTDYQRYRLQ